MTLGHKLGTALVVVILGCTLAWAANWLASEMTKPALYQSLETVMADRKRLWTQPRNLGGMRETKIDEVICPMVDASRMDMLHQQRPDLVARNVVTHLGGVADGTVVWSLRRPISALLMQILLIYIEPDGACRAIYRHAK